MSVTTKFSYIDGRDMSLIARLIDQLNKFAAGRDEGDIMIPFVDVCSEETVPCGLIYYSFSQEQYLFVPDMTGDGIDRESLDY